MTSNDIRISYALLAWNELEIENVLTFLCEKIDKSLDEIIIVLDENKVTPEIEFLIETFRQKMSEWNLIKVYKNPLNDDFSSQKNFMKSKCSGDWIIQIDADENISDMFVLSIKQILELNDSVDVILVPRINIVDGVTEDDLTNYNWVIDDNGRINWPDFQHRILKNKPEILWKNKVHEVLTGAEKISILPAIEELSLLHVKTIDRQRKQNEYYSTLMN